MKRVIFFLLLAALTLQTLAQRRNSDSLQKEAYLNESRHQKTIGCVLLFSGLAAIGISIPFFAKAKKDQSLLRGLNDAAVGLVIGGGGTLLSLGSIPLFVSSAKNKRKALSIAGSFQIQNAPIIQMLTNSQQPFPAMALQLHW